MADWKMNGTAALPTSTILVYTTATKPTAAAGYARTFITVKDPAAAEELFVCLESNVDGVYDWVTVATGVQGA